jgi:ribosomal protein S18 acetylase RimI-like enzyme
MTASLPIRTGTDADAASLQRCLDAVARERRWIAMTAAPPADIVAEFRRQLRAGGGVDLIAIDAQGEVIGWIDIQRLPWEGMRHVGSLGMGVRVEWRRRGVGRALLTAALTAASERGITRVELEVFASNSGAVRLYETTGFAHEGRKRGARQLDGTSDDVLVMARRGDGAI